MAQNLAQNIFVKLVLIFSVKIVPQILGLPTSAIKKNCPKLTIAQSGHSVYRTNIVFCKTANFFIS
jgi:hypothetical protein